MLHDMIRITPFAIALSAFAVVNSTAVAIEPGVYYCITDRMVGIQPKDDETESKLKRWNNRFVGKLNPTKEKFIFKVYDSAGARKNLSDDLDYKFFCGENDCSNTDLIFGFPVSVKAWTIIT